MKVLRTIRLRFVCAVTISLFSVMAHHSCFSQSDSILNARVNGPSLGIIAGVYSYDAGLGLEATTRTFLKNQLSLRLRGTVNWMESYKVQNDHWATYKYISALLVYNMRVRDRGRIYIEAGPIFLLPNNKVTQKSFEQGFSGMAGVELFGRTPRVVICYFFSGGLAYCNASADKLEGRTNYGNGFVFNNGLRFYFPRKK